VLACLTRNFTVDVVDGAALLKAWKDDATWMKSQAAASPRNCIAASISVLPHQQCGN
jgi:hypothetical protein